MDKAQDVVSIKLPKGYAIADYIVVASGTSSRHVNGLANKLKERLKEKGLNGINTEGMEQCDWVVVDAGDIIIHIFRPEVREFYHIEKMWSSHSSFEVVSDQVLA